MCSADLISFIRDNHLDLTIHEGEDYALKRILPLTRGPLLAVMMMRITHTIRPGHGSCCAFSIPIPPCGMVLMPITVLKMMTCLVPHAGTEGDCRRCKVCPQCSLPRNPL